MTPRSFLLLATTAATAVLALPSGAGADPIWDCTDVPFRVTPFSCFAYHTVEGVLDQLPPVVAAPRT
jgi:hypothetical protein